MFHEAADWFVLYQREFCKYRVDNIAIRDNVRGHEGKCWTKFRNHFIDCLLKKDYRKYEKDGRGYMLVTAEKFDRPDSWFGFTTQYYDFVMELFSGNLIKGEFVGTEVKVEPFCGSEVMKITWKVK